MIPLSIFFSKTQRKDWILFLNIIRIARDVSLNFVCPGKATMVLGYALTLPVINAVSPRVPGEHFRYSFLIRGLAVICLNSAFALLLVNNYYYSGNINYIALTQMSLKNIISTKCSQKQILRES